MIVVSGDTPADAWRAGAEAVLAAGGEIDNLVVEVTTPLATNAHWLQALCPRRVSDKANSIRDVANTIFPRKRLSAFPSRSAFYDHYSGVYSRGHRLARNRHAWGTYFQRLTAFGPSGTNQLERTIDCLLRWRSSPRAAHVFHLSSPEFDSPRPRGAPCWQLAQILCNGNTSFKAVVVYRNHDYFAKVLGNFIGLGRLLQFISDATHRSCSGLVCHSIHAYNSSSKSHLTRLAELA